MEDKNNAARRLADEDYVLEERAEQDVQPRADFEPAAAPALPRLSWDAARGLRVHKKGEALEARPRPVFPWSHPASQIALIGAKGDEIAYVGNPAELDAASREALRLALEEAAYVIRVRRIVEVREETDLRLWRIESDLGLRLFHTKLDEWPEEAPGGGWIIRDVWGDLYKVPPADTLDDVSRKILWAYVG